MYTVFVSMVSFAEKPHPALSALIIAFSGSFVLVLLLVVPKEEMVADLMDMEPQVGSAYSPADSRYYYNIHYQW